MRRWVLAALVGGALLAQMFSAWAVPQMKGGGGVGGTCATANALGRFTAAFTLGCSAVTDDGTNVTLTGRGLRLSTDNTADIGGSHTTLRPANVWVGTLVDSPKFTTTGTGTYSGLTIAAGEAVGMLNGGIFKSNNGATRFEIQGNGATNQITSTSGQTAVIETTTQFTPASGSGSFASLHLNPVISGTSSGTAYGLGIASKTNTLTGGTIKLFSAGTSTADLFTGYTALVDMDTTGLTRSTLYGTMTNCASSASPAVCAAAPAGSAVIAAAATSVVVNTTAVTANSVILITEDQSLNTRLSVTCNTQSDLTVGTPEISARTAGTSFTVIVPVAPTTNPLCFNYLIVN